MKKTICVLLCYATAVAAFGQISVDGIEKIAADAHCFTPKFAPQGDYLLLTDVSGNGLKRYDIDAKKLTIVTDAENAGNEPQISDGGRVIVFRDVQYENNRRLTSIKSIDVATGKVSEVDKPARSQYAFRFIGGTLKVAKRATILSKRLVTDVREAPAAYIVAVEDGDLVLYRGTKRVVLNPNGKGSYIWASISPDSQHIVYMAIHAGCNTFVCDLAGENITNLGYIANPTWLNDEWIVGFEDKDDGYTTISSVLKAAKVDGSSVQTLATPNQPRAMHPTVNAAGTKIAFENDGEIFVMNIHVK